MHPEPNRPSLIGRLATVLSFLYPALFAAAFILDRFALTNSALPELGRPLVVAVAAAGFLTVVLWAAIRNRHWAALLASTVFLLVVVHPVPALVLTAVVMWWAGIGLLRRVRGRRPPGLATADLPVRVASGYAVLLFVAGLWSSADVVTNGIADPPTLPASPTGGQYGPNIYLLLLDGYPRGDTLASEFDFDNNAFESELADLGFRVAADARANHNKTWLTMATMLNAQYVESIPEIAGPPRTAPAQARLAHGLINHAAALTALRDKGYEVVSIPSPVMSTDVTTNATVWTTTHLTSFEISLASASVPAFVAPGAVLDMLAADARGLVGDQLSALASYAGDPGDTRRIAIAHLMSPHPPFILGQEPEYLRECFPGCKVWETTVEESGLSPDDYASRMRTQIGELNTAVLNTLERIVSSDPEAIVIVMSDHGARHVASAADEHFRIFFVARAPGYPELFAADQSPTNVFRRILSDVFGDGLADLPYQAWESDWHLPLDVVSR